MAGQKHILVYVCRHGTTDLNAKDAFRGPIDAPLDKAGIRDAHLLKKYFSEIDISHIFHSDKKRTTSTAKIIAQDKPDVPVNVVPDLQAWNVGDLGGQPKSPENLQIVEEHVDNPTIPLPGGESLNQFKARVQPIIHEAVDHGLETGIPVLLVAHSSVIHEIGCMVCGDHDHTLVEPGGVCAIYIQNGKIDAEPVFKPKIEAVKHRGEIVT